MTQFGNVLLWSFAGMVSGMAILTRSTGIVLIGVVGLALLLRTWFEIRHGHVWKRSLLSSLRDGVVWCVSAAVTIFALLPALWVAPASTLAKLWAWSSNAATEGHENPTFFRGIHTGDPGLFVYPIVLAWRTSPAEWIGIALFCMFFWWGIRTSQITIRAAFFFLVSGVLAIVYLGAMSLGAKKFDRYILPVFPIIAVFAAQGISLLSDKIRASNFRWRKSLAYAAVAGILTIQMVAWSSTRPYRLDYYTPLLGGPIAAQHVLQMGWGQGGDQVVDYLNQQAITGSITVQTSAVPSAFTYFLPDDSPVHFRDFGLGTPAGWFETDYYVAGIQQTQRNIAPWYDLLEGLDPVHSVTISGVSYFDIYNVKNLPLPESLRNPTACNYQFGDRITLMQIIGREETIDLYFLSHSKAEARPIEISVILTAPDGTASYEQVNVVPGATGTMMRATIPHPAAGSDTALKDFTITLSASTDGETLPITAPWITEPVPAAITHSECYYTDPPT